MVIKEQSDFYSGVLFSIVGAAFAIGSFSYPAGSSSEFGPGFFPLWLGGILLVLGIFLIIANIRFGGPNLPREEKPEQVSPIRMAVSIVGSVLVFGVLIAGIPALGVPPMGLIVAIYGLMFVSSFAFEERALRPMLVTATALSVLCYTVFIVILGLRVPVLPGSP